MITSIADYDYFELTSIQGISVDGRIMPLRDDENQKILRGEDPMFIYESICERRAAAEGASPEKISFDREFASSGNRRLLRSSYEDIRGMNWGDIYFTCPSENFKFQISSSDDGYPGYDFTQQFKISGNYKIQEDSAFSDGDIWKKQPILDMIADLQSNDAFALTCNSPFNSETAGLMEYEYGGECEELTTFWPYAYRYYQATDKDGYTGEMSGKMQKSKLKDGLDIWFDANSKTLKYADIFAAFLQFEYIDNSKFYMDSGDNEYHDAHKYCVYPVQASKSDDLAHIVVKSDDINSAINWADGRFGCEYKYLLQAGQQSREARIEDLVVLFRINDRTIYGED